MDKAVYKLPSEFIERMKKLYPRDYVEVLHSFLSGKTPSFRCNLIKVSLRDLLSSLKNLNVKYRSIDWHPLSFLLLSPSQRDFQKEDIYKQGLVYFQNLSSMLPVIFLKAFPKDKVLDLCAAPGSKTTQIVSETPEVAELTAVEKIKPRFYKLLANLKNQGQDRFVKVKLGDGIKFWKENEEYFDKVLVDAPCSAEANFRLANPKSYSYWSYRKVKESQHKQKGLLYSGIKSLKPGGKLVYSTCTFSPEENEEVVNWAIDKFKGGVYLENFNLPFKNYKDGIIEWKGKKYSDSLKFTKRIMPDDKMEGFFIAVLRKPYPIS